MTHHQDLHTNNRVKQEVKRHVNNNIDDTTIVDSRDLDRIHHNKAYNTITHRIRIILIQKHTRENTNKYTEI